MLLLEIQQVGVLKDHNTVDPQASPGKDVDRYYLVLFLAFRFFPPLFWGWFVSPYVCAAVVL